MKKSLISSLHAVRDRFLLVITAVQRDDYATAADELGEAERELKDLVAEIRSEKAA